MSMGNVPDMGNSSKGLRGGNELEGLAGAEGVESKLIPGHMWKLGQFLDMTDHWSKRPLKGNRTVEKFPRCSRRVSPSHRAACLHPPS